MQGMRVRIHAGCYRKGVISPSASARSGHVIDHLHEVTERQNPDRSQLKSNAAASTMVLPTKCTRSAPPSLT
jgi:hypothetical protein